ncbi:MAG: MIP family channel protein [Lachnospiraceae bacterium]|nr:MIP family channel protein [Lachnospiraceae bacterium]
MGSSKKYVAELIGTMVLVIVGCGTAMLVGCDAKFGSGYILTAFAFGLAIVALAYSIGNVSGCHVNPAVSVAFWVKGDLSTSDLCGYIVSQCFGAFAGAGILKGMFSLGEVTDQTKSLGSNGLGNVGGSVGAGILVECVLTFIFIYAILGVTSKKAKHGNIAGLVIGLTLVLVHILGIGLTGTSVNPARSLGPALFAAIGGVTDPIKDVWVFFVGPLLGALLAALLFRFLEGDDSAAEKTE